MSRMDFKEYQAAFQDRQSDLAHFGVLGMKWGVRRYQNKDGSLTPEGVIRYQYNKDTGEYDKRSNKAQKSVRKLIKEHPDWYENPNDEEKNRIKNAKTRMSQEIKDLEKDGWTKSSYGDSVEREDPNTKHIFSICADKDGSFSKTKDAYNDFRKHEKEHLNNIYKQILKNDRFDGWTDNKAKLEKEIRNAKNAYEFRSDGILYGFIGNYGIPELGYHSIEIEYDLAAKKLRQQGLAG